VAKRLSSFDFHKRRGGLYPWSEWLDGSIWRATQGEDFHVSVTSFQREVYTAAKLAGGKAQTSVEDNTVTFQFRES
jgi:hypothetical protein